MGKVNFYLILFFIIFSLFFYAENSDADSCPAAIASLLGSGCHDMGSAYFNGEMTQYVNYGGTVVYSCSTNYLSGCSSGSSTGGGGGVPATPSNLRSDPAPAATAIYLAWNDNSYNEDKFNLEREVANSANWATLTQTGPNIISYTDLTAISATTYNYRVQACLSGYGCSEYVYLTGVSLSAPSDIQPPSTPTGFSAYAISSSQINLFWTASSDNAGVSGYKIYRNESLRDQVTVLSFSDTGLNSNTSYGYYVRAFDATGNESSPSSIVSAITYSVSATTTGTTTSTSCPSSIANLLGSGCHDMGSAYFNGEMTQYVNYGGAAVFSCSTNYIYNCSVGSSGGIPSSHGSLRQTSSTASSITLAWYDNSYNEDKFNVEREIPNSANWATLTQTGPNIISYTYLTAISATTYNYRVQACLTGYSCSGYTYLYVASTNSTPTSTPTSTTTSTSCPSSIANLLGSGCHDMGSSYFNGEMTQYVNYGGSAVYSCASNYLSGCSGSSNTVATSTADIIPPYVVKFGYTVESDGRLRAGASFSEGLRDSTLTDSNIYIINSATGAKISGAVNKYQGGIDYFTSSPAEAGINYQLIVKKNVKDLAGNQMLSDYYSAFFKRGPAPVSSVFAVDTSATLPKNNETGVDVGLKIKVKLTKAIDQASTLKQFFALEANNAPGVAVGGSFYMSGDGFEFAPSFALMPGTTYTYKVLASLKDSGGNYLSAPFSALFTTASGVMSGSAAVSGTVRDGAKNPVVGATVHIFAEDYSRSFSIATDSAGAFRMSIAGGSYVAEILPPSGRNYLLKPQPVKFSISSGEAKTLDLSFISGAKIISGLVSFPDLKPVTDAEVGAYSSETNQWSSAYTDSSGKYTLTIGGGIWKIGIRPRSTSTATWSWNESLPEVTFSQDASGETKTVNFIVTFANATLVVYTVDNYGNPLPNAGVVVDTLSSTQVLSSNEVRVPPKFRQSDSSGKVTILLAPRIYYIRGSLPSELGYFNPPEQEINLPSAETRQMRLVFRKPEVVSFVTVSGSAILDNGEVADNVFVSAWSEKGGFMETRADLKGAFSMRMTSCERWRIAAGKNYGGFPYKSSELIMDVGYKPLNAELVLVKVANRPLPASVNVVQSAATQIMAQVEDGAKIVIPPKSAAGSGSVSVEIAPTVEAPSQAAAKDVSTVYDVTIRDAGGSEITKLSQDAEIALPYDEAMLKDQGVGEDALVPSYFDETAKVWVSIDNYIIDKDKNIIVARVSHLTRFAIIAAADITPPMAPLAVSARALGGGKIEISWKNPLKDFSHAKLYRSEKTVALGKTISPEITAASFIDTDITDGVVYYYTVRAVDPAGSESTNTDQVSARAVGTSQKISALIPSLSPPKISLESAAQESKLPPGQAKKLEILQNLTLGSSGDDVKVMQELLLQEGVYPA